MQILFIEVALPYSAEALAAILGPLLSVYVVCCVLICWQQASYPSPLHRQAPGGISSTDFLGG